MFICEKCCIENGVDTFWFIMPNVSVGLCESCRKTKPCIDYHGDFHRAEEPKKKWFDNERSVD